jgi:hypothetical protein
VEKSTKPGGGAQVRAVGGVDRVRLALETPDEMRGRVLADLVGRSHLLDAALVDDHDAALAGPLWRDRLKRGKGDL